MVLLKSTIVVSQNNFVNVIPPFSHSKCYGNTNVSLYTGALKVGVPIHTIKLNELEFPINLDYSGSGGINLQEIASWVGLGWTLNSTGVVSRTINGLADDKANAHYGYLNLQEIPPNNIENLNTYVDFSKGRKDAEPDWYSYNAKGISESFYINKS